MLLRSRMGHRLNRLRYGSLCSNLAFFRSCSAVWTASSARPFDWRYVELLFTWLTPHSLANRANSCAENWGPFSDTPSSGMPCRAKMDYCCAGRGGHPLKFKIPTISRQCSLSNSNKSAATFCHGRLELWYSGQAGWLMKQYLLFGCSCRAKTWPPLLDFSTSPCPGALCGFASPFPSNRWGNDDSFSFEC